MENKEPPILISLTTKLVIKSYEFVEDDAEDRWDAAEQVCVYCHCYPPKRRYLFYCDEYISANGKDLEDETMNSIVRSVCRSCFAKYKVGELLADYEEGYE